jgi:hypothetical protein
VPDPFATADDAAGYGFPLPDSAADGLLARATQALVDAAGFGILSGSATVKLRSERGVIDLRDVPLITAVGDVEVVNEDGTTESTSDWVGFVSNGGTVAHVRLGHTVPGRHCGLFAVTLTQGLPSVPDSLKMLTSAVAYRFAAMVPAMSAGITSQSVGSVSWTASKPPPSGGLTDGECCQLGKIVPIRRVLAVRM